MSEIVLIFALSLFKNISQSKFLNGNEITHIYNFAVILQSKQDDSAKWRI